MIFLPWDLHVEISSSSPAETQSINTILEVDSHPISTLGSKHAHLEIHGKGTSRQRKETPLAKPPYYSSIYSTLQQPLALRHE